MAYRFAADRTRYNPRYGNGEPRWPVVSRGRVPRRSVGPGRACRHHARPRRSRPAGQCRVSLRRADSGAAARGASAATSRSNRSSTAASVTIGGVRVSFHPAGHVLGSAQIRIESADGVWVVSGDYKRAADPTCAPFEPVRCDTFITESTFGLPIYRWDDTTRRRSTTSPRGGSANADGGQNIGDVLLHAGQGAAAARGVDAGHQSARVRARHDAGDDRGLPRSRRPMLPVTPVIERAGRERFRGGVVRRRARAGAAVRARHAMDTPPGRRLGRIRVGADARARRPPPARLQSGLRPLRPRRLARAAADHRSHGRVARSPPTVTPSRSRGTCPARLTAGSSGRPGKANRRATDANGSPHCTTRSTPRPRRMPRSRPWPSMRGRPRQRMPRGPCSS